MKIEILEDQCNRSGDRIVCSRGEILKVISIERCLHGTIYYFENGQFLSIGYNKEYMIEKIDDDEDVNIFYSTTPTWEHA